MPETRAFLRQLVAYFAAFLPTAPYFKSNNGRISAVCNDQYSSTCRAKALVVSDDEEGADLISPGAGDPGWQTGSRNGGA